MQAYCSFTLDRSAVDQLSAVNGRSAPGTASRKSLLQPHRDLSDTPSQIPQYTCGARRCRGDIAGCPVAEGHQRMCAPLALLAPLSWTPDIFRLCSSGAPPVEHPSQVLAFMLRLLPPERLAGGQPLHWKKSLAAQRSCRRWCRSFTTNAGR